MDNRIKERLTGALILVALLVIFVPEMLSGPDTKKAAGDAPPARPATEGPPLRSYTLDLDAPADKRPAGQSALNVQTAPPADEPAPAPPTPAAPVEPGRTESNVASPTVAAPTVAAPPAPAAAPPAPANPQARPSRTPSGAGWQVQVGSFAQRVNAERYAQQLAGKGFKAQVSSSTGNGRELFRVRVGPVADRDAAVALQSRLASQGIRGSLAAP